jgi:hypothetical protein
MSTVNGGLLVLAEYSRPFEKRMARDNRTWGAERILGELLKLGVQGSKDTIQKDGYDTRESGVPQADMDDLSAESFQRDMGVLCWLLNSSTRIQGSELPGSLVWAT